MTFLSVERVSKRYGPVTALKDIDLSVEVGSRTAVVGPSASGKTTLLRILAGFEVPDEGRVMLDGQMLAESRDIVPAHRRSIGFVAQEGALFPHLNVAENIGFGLDRREPKRDQRIRDLMELVELNATMARRRPHELSGGQQQRVALARALARRPRLMLLDEPFSALDTALRESMRRAVGRILRAAGMTTILVTHDQAEALSFADQLAVLRGGRLVQVGSPRDLYSKPVDRDTATFLGDALILSAELEDGWARCRLGRVAAATGARRGAAEIMLRPEQVSLEPAPGVALQGGSDASPCFGLVTQVEFAGAACTIAVVLRGAGAADESTAASDPLLIRSPSFNSPSVGSHVRIAVRGEAHVLASADPQGRQAP
ncbi:MAG TPA: ABC transporter ATP-binding protein [Xanthobacteraceae bacterium]|jgi:iron(III) transport system ATP-binding protein|nr:ABC transporter ATP-binding protein [Xanthobacteraceae bacterium]